MIRSLVLAALTLVATQEEEPTQNSYKGKAPPELVSKKGHWINAAKLPELEKLKGKVVWLEFSFLG